MGPPPTIQYLQRRNIDESQWNNCISNAPNGLIYAYTFYLDAMAGNWDALVLNNYEMVMPLPWRKKGGIHYLYQPFLTAQLGVFGSGLTAELFTAFLEAVPKKFRYWDFSFNHQNLFANTCFPLHQRMNFVLPLNKPYQQLRQSYRENIRRNTKKSGDYGNTLTTQISLDQVIELTKFQVQPIAQKDLTAFHQVFQLLHEKGTAKIYGIISANGHLLSSAVFLYSHNRAYYILVGNHPNGRTLGASHSLIDGFIKDHAEQNLLLDFEGSDLRNLAFFYRSFGAREEPYAAIQVNRLPWWIKWLK